MKKNNIIISSILLILFTTLFSLKIVKLYKDYSEHTIVCDIGNEDSISNTFDAEEFILLSPELNLSLYRILIIVNNYLPVFFIYFLLIMGFFKPPKMNISFS